MACNNIREYKLNARGKGITYYINWFDNMSIKVYIPPIFGKGVWGLHLWLEQLKIFTCLRKFKDIVIVNFQRQLSTLLKEIENTEQSISLLLVPKSYGIRVSLSLYRKGVMVPY